jgi:hypothetical protein
VINLIKLIEPVRTDTNIDWWNDNRIRLNEVIAVFNNWQTEHKFGDFEKEVLKAKINLCREFGNNNDFSEWQFKMLDEMESFVKEYEKE